MLNLVNMLNRLDVLEYIKVTGTPITFSDYAKLLVAGEYYPNEEEALKAIRDYRLTLPSQGVGDTIAKFAHGTSLDKLAEMYTKITGKPCGCSNRQDALNKLLPYGVTEEKNLTQRKEKEKVMKTFLSIILMFLVVLSVLFVTNRSYAGTVVLVWDPPASITDITGFKVYYANTRTQPFTGTGAVEGASGTVKIVKGTNTATLTNLDNKKAWYFAVTAYNATKESGYSNIVAIPIIPVAPVVTTVGGDKKITLTWPAVTTSWGYRIYSSRTSPVNKDTAVMTEIYTNTYTHTGLADNEKYYYKVVAMNGGLDDQQHISGVMSAEVSATTTGSIIIVIPGLVNLKCTIVP